jgi:hypothetical protein
VLGDEFAVLGHELNRELSRALVEIRTRHEELVRSNRLKPDDVPESLDADLRAAVSHLDGLLLTHLERIVGRIGAELGVGIPVSSSRIEVPPEVASLPETIGDRSDALSKVTSLMPSLFGVALLPSVVRSVGFVLPAVAPLAPFAAAAGLALIPFNLVQRRRAKNQQDATRITRESIERARIELPPVVTRSVLTVRRQIEAEVHAGIARRERELAAAIAHQRELADADASQRERAREEAEKRLEGLHELGDQADLLDRAALDARSGALA